MASEATLKLFQKIMKTYLTGNTGFDTCLRKVSLVSCGVGHCLTEMKVEEEHVNKLGNLHGGCIATLVDVVSTFALMSVPEEHNFGVSVELSISYLKGAKLGDVILIDAKSLKVGRNLAFLEAVVKNKQTGELVATGKHTKFVGGGGGNSRL